MQFTPEMRAGAERVIRAAIAKSVAGLSPDKEMAIDELLWWASRCIEVRDLDIDAQKRMLAELAVPDGLEQRCYIAASKALAS
jgi:hypothetical protein